MDVTTGDREQVVDGTIARTLEPSRGLLLGVGASGYGLGAAGLALAGGAGWLARRWNQS